jgi:asparagine synthase (glutamine-hydrolysing)
MCGIAGLIARDRADPDLLARMTGGLAHRGPDDEGTWLDPEAKVGLGHRRLSIIDLSPAGHEPMHSASGRYVVTFNGEIYNFDAMRRRLEQEGSVPAGGWRGHSDIEVLLEAIDAWGLQAALDEAVGMFAFAMWDRRERSLSLVRDRFGEKPLYYGWVQRDFLFGSELKAFRAHPGFDNEIDRQALHLLAARTYIPAPLSIYRRIFKLPPGCILTMSLGAAGTPLDEPPVEGAGGLPRLERYWSYREVVRRGLQDPIQGEEDAIAELDRALSQAVAGQSVADVPVGVFLSGGVDSSAITALYQRNSARPVRTFSIGFEDRLFNEAPFARRIAEQLGTVHHEQTLTERDALDTIPLLATIYDEPFADSSQIPTYLVSRMARDHVTVALTGDGGDELFGGYYRHFYAPRMWQQISRVPPLLRAAVGVPLSRVPTGWLTRAGGLLPGHGRSNIGAKIQKSLRVSASARQVDDVYASFLDEWSFERSPVLGDERPRQGWDLDVADGTSDAVRMMYCDAVSYLPDDILCKVDRASMAVSLETRVPFLDRRVAEVAARIPIEMKVADGEGKRILRKLLHRDVPRELFDRPKAGFGIPLADWLRGPLRGWAEELLNERRLSEDGYFDAGLVGRRWAQHLSGRRDSPSAIWAILMFQAWLEAQASGAAEPVGNRVLHVNSTSEVRHPAAAEPPRHAVS